MGATALHKNRAIRQEALREQLSKQKHVEQVIVNIEKIEALDPFGGNDTTVAINILKTANDQRLKLIGKYLPDLKTTELTGEGGGAVAVVDYTQYTDEELQALAEKEGL